MTPKEIEALPAGPALDALVAERVMGWTGRDHELWMEKGTGKVTKWATDNVAPHGVTTDCYFRPSTEIAAAWKVVKKMTDEGYEVEMFSGNVSPGSFCEFRKTVERIYKHFARSEKGPDIMPLVICRAALGACLSGDGTPFLSSR